MANLFFTVPEDLSEASQLIFQVLGASSVEGDSANVLGGTYTMISVLGFKIKLELNSYDYEDQYKYMLSVGEDYVAGLHITDEMEERMGELVAQLLSRNLPLTIAQERADGLLIYPAASSS